MIVSFKNLRIAAFIGILIYSLWAISYFFNPHLSFTQSYVSELGVSGQPFVWLFRIGNFVGASLLFTAFYFFLVRDKQNKGNHQRTILIKLMCIATAAAVINAFFPMDCSASQSNICFEQQQRYSFGISQWVHLITSIIMFGCLIYAQYYSTYKIIKPLSSTQWFRIAQLSIVLQIILNVALAIVSFTGHGPIGLLQRASLLLFEVWIVCVLFNKKLNLLSD